MKKTLCLFLIFFSFCNLNPAFAESEIINVLRNENKTVAETGSSNIKHPWSIKGCKGIGSADTHQKIVALTFDDGPHKKYTDKILAILKMNDIKATFFVVGKNVEAYPEVVKATYAGGHVIGNHTYSHYYLSDLSGDKIEEELTKANQIINKVIGVSPFLFRPPYASCSAKSVRVTKRLDLKTIVWAAAAAEYYPDRTSSEKIAAEIVKLVKPGAIILLHDGGGNREKSVEALPIIITALRSQGYEFVTVPELLNIKAYL